MDMDITSESENILTLYCNGLGNTEDKAQEAAKALEKIIGKPVDFCYNHGRNNLIYASITTAVGILSILADNPLSAATVFVGSATLLHRSEERNCAEVVAEKIQNFLKKHRFNRVMLILHSQGRDIGNEALDFINPEFKNRIKVITLGSSPIAEGVAAKVINIQQQGDYIPSLMAFWDTLTDWFQNLFSSKNNSIALERKVKLIGGYSHSLSSYLSNAEVQQCLISERQEFIEQIALQAMSESTLQDKHSRLLPRHIEQMVLKNPLRLRTQ